MQTLHKKWLRRFYRKLGKPTWRFCLLLPIILIMSLLSQSAQANKVIGTGGYYSLKATNSEGTAKVSNPGHFRLIYDHGLGDQWLMSIGYSIYILTGSGIEFGYGLDLGARYYPFTYHSAVRAKTANTDFTMRETWRPFTGLAFNQRQYQGIQSSYAGFSLELGLDYSLVDNMSLQTSARYMVMKGPFDSALTEWSLVGGIAVELP